MVKWLKLVTSGIELVLGFYVILLVAWKSMGGYESGGIEMLDEI
jgi:hypothetical protein